MTKMTGTCPLCDAQVTAAHDTEVSEILSCPDCSTKLVVKKINANNLVFEEAPEVEEDWGQ